MRTRLQTVRHDVNQKVSQSQALRSLEELIKANGEYFGDGAGEMLAKEKVEFDQKVAKGRYATLCKN